MSNYIYIYIFLIFPKWCASTEFLLYGGCQRCRCELGWSIHLQKPVGIFDAVNCWVNLGWTTGWWFGTWILWLSIQLGMSSSQLTNSYFSEGLKPPTRQVWSVIVCFLLHMDVYSSLNKLKHLLIKARSPNVYSFIKSAQLQGNSSLPLKQFTYYGWLQNPSQKLVDGLSLYIYIHTHCLVVWNIFHFSIILGISSSQLTNSIICQRGWAQPPTSH